MTYIKKGYTPWNKGSTGFSHTQEPQPFIIPKGYRGGFTELEVGMNHLWMGKKKFLDQFHLKKKDPRKENLQGLDFNTSL